MMPMVRTFRFRLLLQYADVAFGTVLTKVVVYAGIGIISTEGMPLFFSLVGWGIRAW